MLLLLFYLHSVCGMMFYPQCFYLDFHCLLLPWSSSNMNLILPTNSHDPLDLYWLQSLMIISPPLLHETAHIYAVNEVGIVRGARGKVLTSPAHNHFLYCSRSREPRPITRAHALLLLFLLYRDLNYGNVLAPPARSLKLNKWHKCT